jgi:hypothetical protein
VLDGTRALAQLVAYFGICLAGADETGDAHFGSLHIQGRTRTMTRPKTEAARLATQHLRSCLRAHSIELGNRRINLYRIRDDERGERSQSRKRSFDRLYERCTSADVAQSLARRELGVLYRELLRAETSIVAYEKSRTREITDEALASTISRDLAGEAFEKLQTVLHELGDRTDLENRRLGDD